MMEQLMTILHDLIPTADLTEDTQLIEEELLDSFDMVSLVGEIYDVFDIELDLADITPENFATPKTICGLIERALDA